MLPIPAAGPCSPAWRSCRRARRRRGRRGRRGGRARRVERLPALPGDHRGAVLPRPGTGAARHHRGAAGRAARADPPGRRCRLPADRGGARRRLALRRRRRLLGRARQGSDGRRDTRGETFLAAPSSPTRAGSRPSRRSGRAGTAGGRAHPLQGVPRRPHRLDQPAVLPRRRQRGGLPRPPPTRRAAAQDTTNATTASRGAPDARAFARVTQAGGLARGAGRRRGAR